MTINISVKVVSYFMSVFKELVCRCLTMSEYPSRDPTLTIKVGSSVESRSKTFVHDSCFVLFVEDCAISVELPVENKDKRV